MSQKKVEQYKLDKANRKSQLKKEKFKKRLTITFTSIIVLAVIGWVGYSAYHYADENKVVEAVDINFDSVNAYLATI